MKYHPIKVLENEVAVKRTNVEELNSTAALLTKYRHQQLVPSLAVVNSRWAELTAQIAHHVSMRQNKDVGDKVVIHGLH